MIGETENMISNYPSQNILCSADSVHRMHPCIAYTLLRPPQLTQKYLKLCDEKEDPLLSLKESQWKL